MKNKIRIMLALLSLLTLCILSGSCSSGHATSEPAGMVDPEFAADLNDPEISVAIKAISEVPGSASGYLRLAATYIKRARETGDFSINRKAIKAVDRAIEIDPDSAPARKLKASLLATFHRFPEARELGLELQKEFPNDPFIYGVLTDANVELGNYDEAVRSAQKMIDLKPNSSSYARAGHLRSLYGDHPGAIEMMTLATRTADPNDKEAQSWCLVTLGKEYFKAGELEKAENVVDEALRISPEYGLALVEKARIRAANRDYKGADEFLSKTRFPTPDGLILSGDLYGIQGKTTEAEQRYQAAEDLGRGLEGDLHRFALLWADHDTRLEEALLVAQNDYATNKDIYAADILAWCLYKNGRFREAQQVITAAMRLNTNDARIFYHAGMIWKAMGDPTEARRLLRLSLTINQTFDLIQGQNAQTALADL